MVILFPFSPPGFKSDPLYFVRCAQNIWPWHFPCGSGVAFLCCSACRLPSCHLTDGRKEQKDLLPVEALQSQRPPQQHLSSKTWPSAGCRWLPFPNPIKSWVPKFVLLVPFLFFLPFLFSSPLFLLFLWFFLIFFFYCLSFQPVHSSPVLTFRFPLLL